MTKHSFKHGNTKMTHSKFWWEVREDPDGLKDPGGFREEVAFALSLGRAWRRKETAVGGIGQAHVPGGVGLEVLQREEPGLAGYEVEDADKVR